MIYFRSIRVASVSAWCCLVLPWVFRLPAIAEKCRQSLLIHPGQPLREIASCCDAWPTDHCGHHRPVFATGLYGVAHSAHAIHHHDNRVCCGNDVRAASPACVAWSEYGSGAATTHPTEPGSARTTRPRCTTAMNCGALLSASACSDRAPTAAEPGKSQSIAAQPPSISAAIINTDPNSSIAFMTLPPPSIVTTMIGASGNPVCATALIGAEAMHPAMTGLRRTASADS